MQFSYEWAIVLWLDYNFLAIWDTCMAEGIVGKVSKRNSAE